MNVARSNLVAELTLDDARLEEIRRALAARIGEGLEADGREIAALPAFLPPPPPGLSGRAMVVDCGGTNIRAALVEVHPDHGPSILARSHEERIRTLEQELARANDRTGEGFFTRQARLLREIVAEPGLPLGYCFSFPAAGEPSGDARLIRFTKDLAIPGVEGTQVGRRLAEALSAAGIGPARWVVENDTVASLIGGAGVQASAVAPAERFIGLIVGTGTNLAGFFSSARAPKLVKTGAGRGPMAINLESAAFAPPHLTRFDDAVDAASERPGSNRFEKALSGRYLPYLLKAALPELELDPERGSGPVVQLRDSEDADPRARAAARALIDRSADLVASSLAAMFDHYGPGPRVTILAEGSLIWKTPGYAARVEATLGRMAPGQPFLLTKLDDANLFGAAYGALTPL
jgi:hexokinase